MAITKVTVAKPYYTLDDDSITISVTFKAVKAAKWYSVRVATQEMFTSPGSSLRHKYEPFATEWTHGRGESWFAKTITAGSTYTISRTIGLNPRNNDQASTWGKWEDYVPNIEAYGAGVELMTSNLADPTSGDTADYFTYGWDEGTTPVVSLGLRRRVPIINDVELSDTTVYNATTAYDRYGSFIQHRSSVGFEGINTLDLRDPLATFEHTLTVRDRTGTIVYDKKQTNENTFDMGTVLNNFEYSYHYSVKDDYNNLCEYDGTFDVTPYTSPMLTKREGNDLVARIAQHLVGEQTVWELDEMGNDVWLNYIAIVSDIPGNTNPWHVDIKYFRSDDADHPDTVRINNFDGADVFNYVAVDRIDALPTTGQFLASKEWQFSLSITDWFDVPVVLQNVVIEIAEAYFDVEPYGVAIGKLSEGSQQSPLFECVYPAKFYGKVTDGYGQEIGGKTYSMDEEIKTADTWINGKPIYRKTYRKLSIAGANADTTTSVATISDINLDELIRYEGFAHQSNGTRNMIPTYYASNNYKSAYVASGTTLNFRHNEGSTSVRNDVYITLYYTKTTDEATTIV